MALQLKEVVKNIDSVVIQILNMDPNQDPQKLRNKIKEQFVRKLKTLPAEETQNLSNIISMIENCSQEKCQESQPKRGRPLKNTLAERQLAQWIKGQNKDVFTKKQIDIKYKQLTKATRTLSSCSLTRILITYGLAQIRIQKLSSSKKSTPTKNKKYSKMKSSIILNPQKEKQEEIAMFSDHEQLQLLERSPCLSGLFNSNWNLNSNLDFLPWDFQENSLMEGFFFDV